MISMIAAMTNNRVIGKDNELPWHAPEDLEWFKKQTKGKPVVLGRKTHESIGRVLKGRDNIVITRNANYVPLHPAVKVYTDLEKAISDYRSVPELMIIGGQQIYEQALEHANRIYLTIFNTELVGDAFFPALDNSWKITYTRNGRVEVPFPYTFNIFEK